MFRFECAWIAYPFFKDLITESWKNQDDLVNDTTVSPQKKNLVYWKKNIFGNVAIKKIKLLACWIKWPQNN